MTVNGTTVDLDAEPRHTLADTLRNRLRLTGVHLGCEHGVCGMCTVLVDGRAVRSCLLFTVQLGGADITTVEALGTPAALHPLQQAFHAHHALQCGFCTPAFLLSAYELLRDNPTLDKADLPAELSGILCRCTGYKQILDAVREVAATYPDGVPPPASLGHDPALALRAAPGGGMAAAMAPAPATGSGGASGAGAPGGAREAGAPAGLTIPQGEPTATVDLTTRVGHDIDAVWRLLTDIPRTARCLPGAELGRQTGPATYTGHARITAGPLRLTFDGTATIIETDPGTRTLRVIAAGDERGGSAARADVVLHAVPDGASTTLRTTARLFLAGRIARFGRSIAGDIGRGLFEQFARNVDAALAGAPAAAAPAPLRAGNLLRAVLATAARRLRAWLQHARDQ